MRVAIVGLGNCASALIQGAHYYSRSTSRNGAPHDHDIERAEGLISETIGQYTVNDLSFVVGFDIDARKIGKPIKKAIFELPNCCATLSRDVFNDDTGRFDGPVIAGPLLDGVAAHMFAKDILDPERFYVSPQDSKTIYACCGMDFNKDLIQEYASVLKTFNVDVLVNYLPVGSQVATEFWASCCLAANVQMVNCIPVFIASEPAWAAKFKEAKLCIIGDDMKSQFGASVLSQALQELAKERGHKVKIHIQQNSGGNTDFLNMTTHDRLKSKKISKENVLKNHGTEPDFCHAGPSDYIRCYKDKKVATFHLELEGFCGSPVILDARLEVQDSPNSAGIVIDAIRYVKVAHERGLYGAVEGPSAFTQKSPPKTLTFAEALEACKEFKS